MADEDTESNASSSSYSSIVTSEDESSSSSPARKRRGIQVPSGYQSIAPASNASSTFVSTLNAQDIGAADLWVIRLPKAIRPRHLAGLQLDLSAVNDKRLSPGQQNAGEVKVGEIDVGEVEYDILAEWIPAKSKPTSPRQDPPEVAPETNELSQLVPLLPNQRTTPQETHIVLASQQLSRAIFFRRRIPKSEVSTSTSLFSILTEKSCVVASTSKRPQPPGLELRNIPYGADLNEVGTVTATAPAPFPAPTPSHSKNKSAASETKPSHPSKRHKSSK
ncbi:hypothetical protein PCANC_03405 [Puccinia coronata f. sp. avenae]|uniref:Uncharacterized protein n=1 Tax=Puccinia coronata f. sp. avenae TaxID=200324 RepID=A0A2N5W2F4_9BASI|nr:hypothetical protein PCANC_28021 [Puccinia coronata f. sp. avenae]PLW08483.1 hypothetical protein PCANC_22033 [Puccinia coronata f. sp. avenae]PLW19132.1 hypothetical protein PCASD_14047 [Puccinia coronata f. sp. avenae]PLW49622.1 hypothetical protein PCASD_02244 [Puccinia coronata f. sp. avenae]PLW56370.1 hypothetical protein PCANC_03405 [Puccinia coronata f. sp. avenae]